MRVSITDRCDLRCRYCMPEEGVEKVPMHQLLTYEQIERICRQAAALGISRIKVTGGEPLVRRGCPDLIRRLKQIPGIEQVTLTTNGQQLEALLPDLLAAGLDSVNISMDSLREDRYRYITRRGDLSKVLASIDASLAAGLPVKINCLPMKGINEDELADFAAFAFEKGVDVRFIEIMPIGFGSPGTGMSNPEILEMLQEQYPALVPDARTHGNGPAVYYHILGKKGAVGLISALHTPFCAGCNRIRLTSEGWIKPCLSYEDGVDLKEALAGDDEALRESLRKAILSKPGRHCFEHPEQVESKSMMRIGG